MSVQAFTAPSCLCLLSLLHMCACVVSAWSKSAFISCCMGTVIHLLHAIEVQEEPWTQTLWVIFRQTVAQTAETNV